MGHQSLFAGIRALSALICALALPLAPAAGQEVGDYLYCSRSSDPRGAFGHAAIYVGNGRVVELTMGGVRANTMDGLRAEWRSVEAASVPGTSAAQRQAAAQLAVDVHAAIEAGNHSLPDGRTTAWYERGWDFFNHNCVDFYQRLYTDSGVPVARVGDPNNSWPTHPGEVFSNYRNGSGGGAGTPGGSGGWSGGGGMGSSGQSGVESWPLWLGPPSAGVSPARAQAPTAGLPGLVALLPAAGPEGEAAVRVVPGDAVSGGAALDAAGVDYTAGSGGIVAAVFAAETAGSVYAHDFPVCARVRRTTIEGILPLSYDGHWWWLMRARNPETGTEEAAIGLTVRFDGGTAVVDSRYLVEDYPASLPGTVYTYQIVAPTPWDALYYVQGIVDALEAAYPVTFANTEAAPAPRVFARLARYLNGNIHLWLRNLGDAQDVRFSGPTWTEPRRDAENPVEFIRTVAPGDSEVDLPVGTLHDAVVYIQSAEFLDKVYVASGYWYAWNDNASGGASTVALATAPVLHAAPANAAAWFVSPPLAEMTGRVSDVLSWGYVGMAYVLTGWHEPVALQGVNTVGFWARGDGKQYRVKLESAAVHDNDFHGLNFTAPTAWTFIRVPFTLLRQEGWGQPVPFTGSDVTTVSFVTVGRPHESIRLAVDRLSFASARLAADLLVKCAAEPETAYALDNVYQAAASGKQVKTQTAVPAAPARYLVKVQNDGDHARSFVLRAEESAGAGWSIAYKYGAADVTSQMVSAGGYTARLLPPGAALVLVVEARPGSTVPGLTSKSATVRVFLDAADTTARDSVRLTTTAAAVVRPDLLIRTGLETDAQYAGDGTYKAYVATSQTKSQVAARGAAARYVVKVQNDGNQAHGFVLKAGESAERDWSVVYKYRGQDITTQIRSAAGYAIPLLARFTGAAVITVEMVPGAGVRAGTRKTTTLKVFDDAADTIAGDTVRAVTTAR